MPGGWPTPEGTATLWLQEASTKAKQHAVVVRRSAPAATLGMPPGSAASSSASWPTRSAAELARCSGRSRPAPPTGSSTRSTASSWDGSLATTAAGSSMLRPSAACTVTSTCGGWGVGGGGGGGATGGWVAVNACVRRAVALGPANASPAKTAGTPRSSSRHSAQQQARGGSKPCAARGTATAAAAAQPRVIPGRVRRFLADPLVSAARMGQRCVLPRPTQFRCRSAARPPLRPCR